MADTNPPAGPPQALFTPRPPAGPPPAALFARGLPAGGPAAPKKKLMRVVLALVVLVVILVAWHWHYTHWTDTETMSGLTEGTTHHIHCADGKPPKVVKATYTVEGKNYNVTAAVQKLLAANGNKLTVSGAALGYAPGGLLSIRFRKCFQARAQGVQGFTPVPVSTCHGGQCADDGAFADVDGRHGTVAWVPYSTQSRVSLERHAESPEVAEPMNSITGVGKGATVRALGDRYRRNEAFQRLSDFELQPGQPGYMEEVGEGATSLMAAVTRRSPAVAGGAAPCLLASADVDSDFQTDGFYDNAVLKEALTSSRTGGRGAAPNALTASRVGLGSTRLDPRFEPGPQSRVASGDASPSHGGHAGGITLGGFGSSKFQTNGGWDWNYVHGFGGRGDQGVEALSTESSLW